MRETPAPPPPREREEGGVNSGAVGESVDSIESGAVAEESPPTPFSSNPPSDDSDTRRCCTISLKAVASGKPLLPKGELSLPELLPALTASAKGEPSLAPPSNKSSIVIAAPPPPETSGGTAVLTSSVTTTTLPASRESPVISGAKMPQGEALTLTSAQADLG